MLKITLFFKNDLSEEYIFDNDLDNLNCSYEYQLNVFNYDSRNNKLRILKKIKIDKNNKINNSFIKFYNKYKDKIDFIENLTIDCYTSLNHWVNAINLKNYNYCISNIQFSNIFNDQEIFIEELSFDIKEGENDVSF